MSLRQMADKFAGLVVAGDYAKAHKMLAGEAASEWPAEELQSEYEEMVEYFEGSPPKVMEGWDGDYSQTKIDEDTTLLYVPISNDDGVNEAVVLTFNGAGEIVDLEFGRP